jgi:hypothetical protein
MKEGVVMARIARLTLLGDAASAKVDTGFA